MPFGKQIITRHLNNGLVKVSKSNVSTNQMFGTQILSSPQKVVGTKWLYMKARFSSTFFYFLNQIQQ